MLIKSQDKNNTIHKTRFLVQQNNNKAAQQSKFVQKQGTGSVRNNVTASEFSATSGSTRNDFM